MKQILHDDDVVIVYDGSGVVGRLYQGDSLAVLKTFPSESIDALVTDPP